jgi:hypothetical protein
LTVARLLPAVILAALLAACGGEPAADDGRAASGEVLEGTISDAMLPLDRVRSEAPLEDPEAFAEVQEEAAEAAVEAGAGGEEEADEAGEAEEAPAIEVPALETD